VLASRRGLQAPGAQDLEQELRRLGAEVRIAACDVGNLGALEGLLGMVPEGMPLRMVVHAAGVLDDGVIGSLTGERLDAVLAPKLDAAWYLHELTQGMELQAFVLFSSAAGTLGAPGQGNYAAANAFLDALASYRRARGMPASSLAWGLWEQSSEMTGTLSEVDRSRLTGQGVLALSNEEGLHLFDLALGSRRAHLIPVRLDLATLRKQARAGVLGAPFRDLVRVTAARAGRPDSLAHRLAGLAPEERQSAVLEIVRSEIAAVLGHPSSQAIDPERSFKDLGFDSLAAVELRNRLNTITALRLPATLVFDYPNPTAVTNHIIRATEVQDGAGETTFLDAEFDRLRQMLVSAVGNGDRVRARVRLQALLAEFDDNGTSMDKAADLEAATDDEMFELIDEELGVAERSTQVKDWPNND
jgi:acyl carrier protein